ncbi:hypothetical protein [Arthrobacter cryoconiti]|uniref:Uncharacterized protein n=1 Tax=Arthrobacter cryoconiti TaxID=748907 RepID=A0ABV8QY28_9MICC|nr:hypothetical protein [Arthrobacter cryoconiti]MCC9068802.1 hypothetical protein [Arthrobacter cryoconiti]
MPTDFKTPLGKVRLLTADLSTPPKISDEILDGYLGLYEAAEPQCAIWRAAADALDAMATSDLLQSRVIRTQDLSVDGAKFAAELRKQAAELRLRADEADAANDSFFDVIPFGWSPGQEGVEEHW